MENMSEIEISSLVGSSDRTDDSGSEINEHFHLYSA